MKSNFWLPTSIDEIVNSFSFDSTQVLKRNIAYNIQYLQYLCINIDEEITTSVLYKMRYKSFIITSISIIEAIFMALLAERNLIPMLDWRETEHKHKQIDENTIEVTFKRKKTKPKKEKIKFDKAITLIKENAVLGKNVKMFPIIRELQELRNRLHLDKAKSLINSDYNSFDVVNYHLTQAVLYNILSNNVVSKNKEYIQFININVVNNE